MSKRAKQLGISGKDLKEALLLIQDFQVKAVRGGLDPRATRIALLFAIKCDTEHAEKKLHPVGLTALESVAEELFQLTRRRT